MENKNKLENLILIPLLVVCVLAFGFFTVLVLAEGENAGGDVSAGESVGGSVDGEGSDGGGGASASGGGSNGETGSSGEAGSDSGSQASGGEASGSDSGSEGGSDTGSDTSGAEGDTGDSSGTESTAGEDGATTEGSTEGSTGGSERTTSEGDVSTEGEQTGDDSDVNQEATDQTSQDGTNSSCDTSCDNGETINEEDEPGSDGGSGDSGGDTVIVTGDVEGEVSVENEVNTNIIETGPAESKEGESMTEEGPTEESTNESNEESNSEDIFNGPGEGEGGTVTNPPEVDSIETTSPSEDGIENLANCEGECQCEEDCAQECQCECDCEIEISNENEAEVGNELGAEGESGENEAVDNSGDVLIDTGNVNLVVGLVNTVNTNLINSDFSQFLLNIFEYLQADINLSDQFDISSQDPCSDEPTQCLNVSNSNEGEIDNEVLIDGSSGSNLAESENGDATIHTGDVNVSTSVFNMLNTNIIGSNWRNLIINIFDNWVGDLLFPNKEKMEEILNSSNSGGCLGGNCGTFIMNSSEGQVENEVLIEADSGLNQAEGDTAIIRTGGATAKANIFNMANTDVTGGTWLMLAINIFGEWQGNVFSLPPGLGMSQDFSGIKIYNLGPEGINNNTSSDNYLSIENENSGVIKNSVVVNVSTGDNSASASNGQALIETGNANALVNLINILNSNIIGANWLFGMINIFGNWQGDVAFGRPDLWIGISATAPNETPQTGGPVTYTLTYMNNGDADATGVTIVDDYDEENLNVTNPGSGVVIDNPGEIYWNIGLVPAGTSGSVSYTTRVNNDIKPGTAVYFTNTSQINSFEDDWNYQDNTDTITVKAIRPYPESPCGMWPCPETPPGPNLEIAKTNNTDGVAFTGSNVDYQIYLYNNSRGPAYEVVVEDVLINEETSEVFYNYSWDLGEVFPYEEITIDYTIAIGAEIPVGFYKNTAKATGKDSQGNPVWTSEVSMLLEVKAQEGEPEGGAVEEPLVEEQTGGAEGTEEVSLDDIAKELEEINGKIEKIREEIMRMIKSSPETPPETLVESVSEVLAPEVLAEEELCPLCETPLTEEPQTEGNGLEKFLAAIGGLISELSLGHFFILLGILFLLLVLLSFLSRKKKSE